MSNIYIVRTRHEYGSYKDWFRLAELSGFPIIYVDEMLQHDSKDTTFIVTPVNGEWNTRPRGYTQGRVILYQLEWNTDGEHNDPPCVDAIWCGDKWHAEKHGYRYVPLGSHYRLNEFADAFPTLRPLLYDVAYMGYKDPPRRARVLREMYEAGLIIAPNGWGKERSAALLASKCMVAIHQFDAMPTIAPLRMCIAAAHKLAVISETVQDKGIFTGYMDDIPYGQLANTTRLIVRDTNNRLKEAGESLYRLLAEEYTFRHAIERAL